MKTREEIAKEMCKLIYSCPDDCKFCETKEIMLWPLYSRVADYAISLVETEIKKAKVEVAKEILNEISGYHDYEFMYNKCKQIITTNEEQQR